MICKQLFSLQVKNNCVQVILFIYGNSYSGLIPEVHVDGFVGSEMLPSLKDLYCRI